MSFSDLHARCQRRLREIEKPSALWVMRDGTESADLIRELMEALEDTSKLRIMCVKCESEKRRRKRHGGQHFTPGGDTDRSYMQPGDVITTAPSWRVFRCPSCGHTIEVREDRI